MSTFQIIDLAIEVVFVLPFALAAINTAAKRSKKRVTVSPNLVEAIGTAKPETLIQRWEECAADDGAWLEEVAPSFVPAPQCEATAEDAALVEAHSRYVAVYWASLPTDNVVPFVRPSVRSSGLNWASLNPYQLRAECSLQGIQWRDVYGKNKHLKKAEMVQILSGGKAQPA